MPFHLEHFDIPHNHTLAHKAIVVNTLSGHHYSKEPIPIKKAKAQLRVLQSAMKKEKK